MSTTIDDLQVWTFDAGPGDDWSADEEFYRADDVRALVAQAEQNLRERLAAELNALADKPAETDDPTAFAIRAVVAEGYRRSAAHVLSGKPVAT